MGRVMLEAGRAGRAASLGEGMLGLKRSREGDFLKEPEGREHTW
jgi:hypothetical protein